MLSIYRLAVTLIGTFIVFAPVAAQTDYCRQARPDAYLMPADMVAAADGVYLVRVETNRPSTATQTINPVIVDDHSEDGRVPAHSLQHPDHEKAPVIPDFKTELQRMVQGRKNPDQITLEPSSAFLATQNFSVLETLRGEPLSELSLSFASIGQPEKSTSSNDFELHHDDDFWTDVRRGRTELNKQCQINMSFENDGTYLVFKGLNHPKAAELISSVDDKWLTYIRQTINSAE